MFSQIMKRINLLTIFILIGSVSIAFAQNNKADSKYLMFPNFLVAKWYSLEDDELETTITEYTFENQNMRESKLAGIKEVNGTRDMDGNFDAFYLIHNADSKCIQCYEVSVRTINIMQYRTSQCISHTASSFPKIDDVCSYISPNSDVITWFRTVLRTVNCKGTWEGTYAFTYEVDQGGGSICSSPRSAIVACQEPGSVYVDNQVFTINFGSCPDVDGLNNKKIRFQCMGSWNDGKGNIYSAMMDIGEVKNRMKFRCMLTRNDQQYSDNTRFYALSRWARCGTLNSPYDGPIRLKMWPAFMSALGAEVYGTDSITPSCNFPRNFTGTWFTTAEFDSHVVINVTHIYFKTKLNQYMYQESVFVCQQTRDGRYLVTAVTVGRCEVDYVCFAFMPRHHNVIRWRMSRPFRLSREQQGTPDSSERIFRQACTWSAFTLNRDDTNWRYYTFILNPPAPVPCPIGGRYNFTQLGSKEEQYVTRIRGITERPRHMIDCMHYTTELKSCDNFPKWIHIDAEYCETLDHTAKPISEYDIPDRKLFCVGYWLEDMKSYMITYDMEDAVSNFRCWVYERSDWRDIHASRAIKAACSPQQTAYSSSSDTGASLGLVLKERERLWDSCPQRYSTGADPYSQVMDIFIVDENSASKNSLYTLPLFVLLVLSVFVHF